MKLNLRKIARSITPPAEIRNENANENARKAKCVKEF